ncbi:MAG: hypothetical protein V7701_11320 [Sneathiella sp.]
MAYAIKMIQPTSHKRDTGYSGVAWTCLFFGPFPALYRGHIFGFIGMTIVNFATLGLSTFVFIFVYNAWHYHSLLSRGFHPAGHQFGKVRENIVEVAADNNNNPEDIFEMEDLRQRRRIMLASPELSENLIDDNLR